MKIIGIFLALCMTLNVYASTETRPGVERSIDEYQYSMTVEWDQQDRTFAEAQTRKLFQEISTILSQGLTTEELLTIVEAKIKNPMLLQQLRLKAQSIQTEDQEELIKMLADSSASFYSEGASWNGTEVAFYGGVALVVISYIAYVTWFNSTYECVGYEISAPHNKCIYEKK